MGRCVSCDCNLNNYEATRKIVQKTGKVFYPDLCNRCFKEVGLDKIAVVVDRAEFEHDEDTNVEKELIDE